MSTSVSPLGQTTNIGAQILTLPAGVTNAAPFTVSAVQSGIILQVPTGYAAAATITLPAPSTCPGFILKSVVPLPAGGAAAVGVIVRFNCGAGLLNSWKMNNATPTSNASQQYIQFTATAVSGDYIEILSDGTSYTATARSTAAAGVASA
jgi:hypothetical protein